jgi:hypothetical protein
LPAQGLSRGGVRLGRPRARSLTRLFPRPTTEPCGTVSVLHGSPVGTLHRFRITGLTPPSPAVVLHLWPFALWLAFPNSDSYGHSVTLGFSSRRPSRRALSQHVSAWGRRSTHAFPALLGRCWTRRGRSGRPLPWVTSPPRSQTLSREALHRPIGLGLQAVELSPCHAGLAEPQCQRLLSVLGFVGRLLFPRPFGSR